MNKIKKDELEELQRVHCILSIKKRELSNWHKDYAKLMTVVNSLTSTIGQQINLIKSDVEEIITDHAIVRYLERYNNLDLEKVKEQVKKLPQEEKIVYNNNIITVGRNIKEAKNKL